MKPKAKRDQRKRSKDKKSTKMKIKSEKDADSGKKTKKSRLACKMIKNTQKRKFAFLSSLFFNAIVTLA